MVKVKCAKCGAERDLTYDQIRVIQAENRDCPSCSTGKERILIREERLQPFDEYLVTRAPVNLASDETNREVDVPLTTGPGGALQKKSVSRKKPE